MKSFFSDSALIPEAPNPVAVCPHTNEHEDTSDEILVRLGGWVWSVGLRGLRWFRGKAVIEVRVWGLGIRGLGLRVSGIRHFDLRCFGFMAWLSVYHVGVQGEVQN